jgi:hypothetical protein
MAVAVEAVQWSGVGALTVWGDAVGLSPSFGGVGSSGPALGKVEMCSTEQGSGWPGLDGDGKPGGECGKGKGALFGGSWRGVPFLAEVG